MEYQARVTVHQRGLSEPDYSEVHRRMATVGYSRKFAAGSLWEELPGMYYKNIIFTSIDAERNAIEQALRMIGFAFSIELFEVAATRVFNLEPVADYSGLLGSLLGGRR